MMPIGHPALQILSNYMGLVEAHRHVSSPLLLEDRNNQADWYKHSSNMLTIVGSALASMVGIAGDIHLPTADEDEVASRFEKECTRAVARFSSLKVPSPWHPDSGKEPYVSTGQDDDQIMRRWRILCDYVAEHGKVAASYGIRVSVPWVLTRA